MAQSTSGGGAVHEVYEKTGAIQLILPSFLAAESLFHVVACHTLPLHRRPALHPALERPPRQVEIVGAQVARVLVVHCSDHGVDVHVAKDIDDGCLVVEHGRRDDPTVLDFADLSASALASNDRRNAPGRGRIEGPTRGVPPRCTPSWGPRRTLTGSPCLPT